MRFNKGRDKIEGATKVVRHSTADDPASTLHSSLFTFNSSGFTLVELLIVTVVIVTLMGIVFRLAGVGGDSRALSRTLSRLQRVENALSGYYAAYGSYPPVPLQGRSRDINVRVDDRGVQAGPDERLQEPNLSSPNDDAKRQVEAACRAQPVAVLYPFSMLSHGGADAKAERMVEAYKSTLDGNWGFNPLKNAGSVGDGKDWHQVNVFQFGLLSFLLPRYQFMLRGDPSWYKGDRAKQWLANNQVPCQIGNGIPYENWKEIQNYLYSSGNEKEKALIAALPSQAVCARWMPNLAGTIVGGDWFFGVDTADDLGRHYLSGAPYDALPDPKSSKWVHQASPRGFNNSGSLYLLDGMTVADGWGHELYYYSEVPYQSYRLWSAGPNGYTFPPWLDVNSFQGKARETIVGWTKDDLGHLATD